MVIEVAAWRLSAESEPRSPRASTAAQTEKKASFPIRPLCSVWRRDYHVFFMLSAHLPLHLHAWPAAPDWQQHDTGRPGDPRENARVGRTRAKIHTQKNRNKPPETHVKTRDPYYGKGRSDNTAWFLFICQRPHIPHVSEWSYSDGIPEEDISNVNAWM